MSADRNDEYQKELDVELEEWLASLDYVLASRTPDEVQALLRQLQMRASHKGVQPPFTVTTPYINTIPRSRQPAFPICISPAKTAFTRSTRSPCWRRANSISSS